MAMVFQNFNLFPHFSALGNVMEAPVRVHGKNRAETEERARHLLTRAVVTQPRIMLSDEPTSALDPELVEEVLTVIRDLAGTGTTMIVVTHEMAFAREVADRCVLMEAGRIVESGPPARIFGNPQTERLAAFLSGYAASTGAGGHA